MHKLDIYRFIGRAIKVPYSTAYLLPLALPLLLCVTYLIYSPGLNGLFMFDDEYSIVKNTDIHIKSLTVDSLSRAATSSNTGPLKRPVSMLSLALSYYSCGLDAPCFKYFNLMIHLLNGVVLFILTRLLLGLYTSRDAVPLNTKTIDWISLAITAAWLLHPLNLTPVLYVVQRMASLVALFTFASIACYLWARKKHFEGHISFIPIIVSLLIFAPLAIFSKENGVLIPFFLFLIEWLILKFHAPNKNTQKFIVGLMIIIAAIPFFGILGYVITHIDWFYNSYRNRTFTLNERVLTETRVIWIYLALLVAPSLSKLGIYHDDIPISTSLTEPLSTLSSSIGILVLLMLAFKSIKKYPLVAFGIFFYFIGHSMESTIYQLEIAHEHRNYLPNYGPILALFYYLLKPFNQIRIIRIRQFLAIAILLGFGLVTAMRADVWGNPAEHLHLNVQHHPKSSRAHSSLARMYYLLSLRSQDEQQAEHFYSIARNTYIQSYHLDKTYVSGVIAVVRLDSVHNKKMDLFWTNELVDQLRGQVMLNQTLSVLQGFHRCARLNECLVPGNLFSLLFAAALDNKTINAQQKATILTETIPLAIKKGDYNQALALARQAKDTYPKDPQHWLNIIYLLISLQKYSDASQILADFEKTKAARPFNKKIAAFKSQITDNRVN